MWVDFGITGCSCQTLIINGEKCQLFPQNIYGRSRSSSCSQIGRSEICLVLDSQRHFVHIFQKLFAFFYNLQNFAQIFIMARILINFLQSQNFTVWNTLPLTTVAYMIHMSPKMLPKWWHTPVAWETINCGNHGDWTDAKYVHGIIDKKGCVSIDITTREPKTAW
jgi:hypothetical protein